MLYTTLSSLKAKLGIATLNTDSDSELSLIIERATNLIDIEIGYNLGLETIQERLDGSGSNKLYLKIRPNSINFVKSKDLYISYDIDYIDGYIVYMEDNIPKGDKNILIEYERGFSEVPKDIEEICLDISVIIATQNSISGTNSEAIIDKNIKTQKLGDLSITYFGEGERTKNSFERLNPSKNIDLILSKYKVFSGII